MSVRITLLRTLGFAMAFTASVVAAQPMEVVETKATITVMQGATVVVTYNKVSPSAPAGTDPIYERSGCLHPINTPAGSCVTAMFPPDHPHQHGVFSAWVKTVYDGREIDFWNLAGGTGRVLHERVVSTFQRGDSAGFEVDLIHRAESDPPVNVLRERWKITVLPSDGVSHRFDLETVQTGLTDKPLRVSEYHYGGIAVRGPSRWLNDDDPGARNQPALVREPSGFLNSLGSNRIAGNHQHAKWVALWGENQHQRVCVAVLCHADNFRAPQSARLHPTKPYFCFAPCVDGPFEIDRNRSFQSKYRFLITDSNPDPSWIQDQWNQWCGE